MLQQLQQVSTLLRFQLPDIVMSSRNSATRLYSPIIGLARQKRCSVFSQFSIMWCTIAVVVADVIRRKGSSSSLLRVSHNSCFSSAAVGGGWMSQELVGCKVANLSTVLVLNTLVYALLQLVLIVLPTSTSCHPSHLG